MTVRGHGENALAPNSGGDDDDQFKLIARLYLTDLLKKCHMPRETRLELGYWGYPAVRFLPPARAAGWCCWGAAMATSAPGEWVLDKE